MEIIPPTPHQTFHGLFFDFVGKGHVGFHGLEGRVPGPLDDGVRAEAAGKACGYERLAADMG